MTVVRTESAELKFLASKGVAILDNISGFDDSTVKIIFGNRAKVDQILTHQLFPHARFAGDWAHAGGESWYHVANIKIGFLQSTLPVAIKAIESMGDCKSRAQTEATRLLRLAPHASKIYALAPCTIVKEWLYPDNPTVKDRQLWDQLSEFMGQIGISLMDSHLQSAACISGGLAKIYDAGWDMTG